MKSSLSILLIRFSSLGDVVLTSALVSSLREAYPTARIDLVTSKEYEPIAQLIEGLSHVYPFDKSRGIPGLLELRKALKAHGYDHILDLHNNFRSNLLRRGLGERTAVIDKRTFKRWLLVKYKYDTLQSEPDVIGRYFETAKSLNVLDDGLGPRLSIKIVRSPNTVAIAPGAKHWNKRWPVEYWIELALSLVESGRAVQIVGSVTEEAIAKTIKDAVPDAINLAGQLTLPEVTNHIAQASLMISNDSGLMHIAEAVGTPLIAIFGPTVQQFGFAPRSPQSIVLEVDGLYCRPCTAIGREDCPEKHFRCMREISANQVISAIPLLGSF